MAFGSVHSRAEPVARPWLIRVAGRPAAAAASLREPPPCAVDASSIAAPAQVLLDPVAPAAPLSSSRSLHFALGPEEILISYGMSHM